MTKKQRKILDEQIQLLCEYDLEKIQTIRQALGINASYSFVREVDTIESLFKKCIEGRKEFKSNFYFASSSGWTVNYFPDKKKYKKNEDFKIQINFSFVNTDNFD